MDTFNIAKHTQDMRVWSIAIVSHYRGSQISINQEGKVVVITPKDARPLVNEACLQYIEAQLNIHVNPNVLNTNFTSMHELKVFLRALWLNFNRTLYMNADKFGLNGSMLNTVFFDLISATNASYRRALFGKDRDFVFSYSPPSAPNQQPMMMPVPMQMPQKRKKLWGIF